ncbi:MAG: tetratricopeptide repeat protein, partial [Chthoniobacteraceae bacterium]|nr:tetratricopeptide repeat protein [Chthoniobacteraceae bacterium]
QAEKLLAENAALTKQLDAAQKTIAAFNAAAPEKEKQIAALKSQLTGVQEQLDAAQKEGGINRDLIAELQKQLEAANTAKAPEGEDQKKLTKENELLRGIVLRELKEQARREQSRKLVMGELERMKVRSKVLTEQVGLLSQPAVTLSADERSLFKTPQMEIVDSAPGALAISIAAPASSPSPKPSAKDGEAAEGALPSDSTPADGSGRPTASAGATVSVESNPAIPPELRSLAREAKDHSNHGRYLDAERAYEKIVSKAPSNIYALSNLGVARFQAGHLKQAEETFKKVLAVAPNDAFAHCTLGIIYYRQARYDDAITHLTQAVTTDPKNAPAHNFLGISASQKGWSEAAQKELDTALQLAPDYADAHYNLAVLLTTLQPPQKESASQHYSKALELGMKPNPKFEATLK